MLDSTETDQIADTTSQSPCPISGHKFWELKVKMRKYEVQITGGTNSIMSIKNLVTEKDVFLMIRRKKVTIFTDAKETTSLGEVKKIIEGICKVGPENQKLFKDDQALTDDHKTLGDYGFTGATARAQAPATLGLAFRQDDGEWEVNEVTSYSSPPELPDVMKPQDSSSSHAQEQSAS